MDGAVSAYFVAGMVPDRMRLDTPTTFYRLPGFYPTWNGKNNHYFPRCLRPATLCLPSEQQAVLDVIDPDDFPVAAFLLQLKVNVVWRPVTRDTDGEGGCIGPI